MSMNRSVQLHLLCALVLLAALPLFAVSSPSKAGASPGVSVDSPAQLLKNINAGTLSAFPDELTKVGNAVFFRANDVVHGSELWRSDGASATMVKDLNPGASDGFPTGLTDVNGTLFFIAYDSANHPRYWKSDGTPAGTAPLGASIPSLADAAGYELASVNGIVFLLNNGGLWRTDGTIAGTMLLLNNINSSALTRVGNRLFFLIGADLWTSDGTVAGTTLVKPFDYEYPLSADRGPGAGAMPSDGPPSPIPPGDFTDVGGTLFFNATDGKGNRGLWKSDGTPAGTLLVKSVAELGTYPSELTNINGTLFFASGIIVRNLWKSDGTPAGTQLVKANVLLGDPTFTSVGKMLFFVSGDGSTTCDVWKSDGTPNGTVLVKHFATSSEYCRIHNLASRGGILFFSLEIRGDIFVDGALWRSDGTAAGTVQVKPINVFGSGVDLPDALFFAADDHIHGAELWRTDGTPGGTALVWDANLAAAHSDPINLTDLSGALVFTSDDGVHGFELWRSDGTPTGTVMVKDINPGPADAYPFGLANIDGTLYFGANDGIHGTELWRSDGTPAGTFMVKDIVPGPDGSGPRGFTKVGGSIFFVTADGLWKSDGTAAGTTLVKGLLDSGWLVNANGTLFLSSGSVLWKSNGTAASTRPITATIGVVSFAAVGDTLFFSGRNDDYGYELWKSDNSAAGASLVKDIAPGSGGSFPEALTNVSGTLYFAASSNGRIGLWRSDGTAAGTTLIKAITSSGGYMPLHDLTALNGTLAFVADDGAHGSELWHSDGTPAGTTLVKDINTGASGSDPAGLANIDGTLLFAATAADGVQGLWRSDGSARGTRLVQQVASGSGFVRAGGAVFFSAYDSQAGNELWALPAPSAITLALQAPALVGAPPDGVAPLSLEYLNAGLVAAQALTLTATLGPGLTYVDQTSPVSPTLSGNTLTWRLPGAGYLDGGLLLLRVRAAAAAIGTRYRVDLTLAASGPSAPPASTAQVEVMVSRQTFLPNIRR